MAHARMVDVYIQHLLGELFDGAFQATGRGYRVPLTGGPLVEVLDGPGYLLRVRVTAPLANDVACGRALLDAVNDVNTRLPYGRVLVEDGQVLAEHTLLGRTLHRTGLDNAVRLIAWVVETFAAAIAHAGGGTPAEGATPVVTAGGADTPAPPGLLDADGVVTVGAGAGQLDLLDATPAPVANAAGYL